MENIKVSVIIPNWNSEKTLEATIRSCLDQTLAPFEIIVCDDGSTDDSKNIVKNMDNPKIIWLSNTHTGTPAIPRNNGMKVSKGDWIAFCDSDDEWLPKKLERQIELIKKTGNKAICTDGFIKRNNIITTKKISNWNKKNISFKNLLNGNKIICSSVLIHKSIFDKIGGFPEDLKYKGFEDYVYWLIISTETNFTFINESLLIYDDHPETSIRANQISDLMIKKLSLEKLISFIKKNKIKFLLYKYKIYQHEIYCFIKKIIKSILK